MGQIAPKSIMPLYLYTHPCHHNIDPNHFGANCILICLEMIAVNPMEMMQKYCIEKGLIELRYVGLLPRPMHPIKKMPIYDRRE